jgi:hypothetical protein
MVPMRVPATVLLLLTLAFSPAAAEEVDEEELKFINSVNRAIDTGLLWVVSKQKEDGSWPGYADGYPMGMTALGWLTILKCDYPRKAEASERAKKYLWERFQKQHPSALKTYSVAVLMMALEEQHAPLRSKKPAKKSRYANVPDVRKVKLPAADYEWMAKCAKWMVANQTKSIWRYPGGGIDLSNTQYALLGLAAARRCNVPVKREVFVKAANYLFAQQEKEGPRVRRIKHVDAGKGYAKRYATSEYDHARGWGYQPGHAATGSMTTAGVSSLAICRSELMTWPGYKGEFAHKMERSIRDGLAWLAKNFTVTRNPGRPGWHYYYLFGLERAGILTDQRFLGDHDWYREGATYLIGRQDAAGSWNAGRGGRGPGDAATKSLCDTCFALLFLRRATVPVKVPRAVTPTPK